MDDLKHLARALVSILNDWSPGGTVGYIPRSDHHHGTPNDLEKARDIAHAILDGRKIHLETVR